MSRQRQTEAASQRDAVILLAIALNAACAELAEKSNVHSHFVKTHQIAKANTLFDLYSSQEKANLLTELWQLIDSL
jgi:hypothetical protein